MENTSPGDRKPAPVSKPINGGCSSKIDNQARSRISRSTLIHPLEASPGVQIQVRSPSVPNGTTAPKFFGFALLHSHDCGALSEEVPVPTISLVGMESFTS